MLRDALEAVAGGGYDVTGAIDCRIGAQRAQNAQAGHYVADTSGTIDAPPQTFASGQFGTKVKSDIAPTLTKCGVSGTEGGLGADVLTMVPITVGALTDGAHQGGGLNGQDAYTGRIFACARQPADCADGQGDQHDIGRGADGDCGG